LLFIYLLCIYLFIAVINEYSISFPWPSIVYI